MDIAQQLVSPDSLATFGGISAVVVGVANSVKNALGWNPPWFPWVLAMTVCVVIAVSKPSGPSVLDIVIALVNGCIVYSSALGMNSLGTAASNKVGAPSANAAPGIGRAGGRQAPPFFSSWL
jgi:hypothetical protein